MNRPQVQHQQESTFHDDWAKAVDVNEISVRDSFESPTALENRFILKLMHNLRGKRLLDVGCGLGESSVYFALQGAEVTAVDISPGMVTTAAKLAKLHSVNIQTITSSGEELDVPSKYFDVVYTANALHHAADKDRFIGNLHKALKVGGRFFSWDPLSYNPVINVYRRMASKVRTTDEAPLTFRELATVKKHFGNVHHREFWLLAQSLFLKFFFVDRIHPNQQRYWKLIYKQRQSQLWWWCPLAQIDTLLTRIPLIKRLAWNMVIWADRL